jgi:class 3 adenylate cyclase
MRNIIAEQGGHVIKTTGDGLHAVFAHASESVAATPWQAKHGPAYRSPLPVS